VIYVYRNPKDILVSYFHYINSWSGMENSRNLEEYMQIFLSGNVAGSLVFDHVKGWYTHQNEFNILFLCYEEMIQDLRGAVLKICKFIGKELSSQEVDKVVEMSTFKNMKADPRATIAKTYEENCWRLEEYHDSIAKRKDQHNGQTMEPSERDLYLHKGCYFVPVVSSPQNIDSLENFEIRNDDTFIITYPKSGHRDGTENRTLIDRAPWLEYNLYNVDFTNCPSPRVICSHLPYYLIPKGLRNKRAKVIYVFRNPKDVLVSSYHFYKMLTFMETAKEFDAYFERFLAGKVPSSLWLDHIEGWYAHKGDFNILFLSYEEMKKDLRSSVLKICNFLGRELTEKEVDDVVDKATFDNMKMDPRANYKLLNPTIADTSKGSERFDRVFKERMEKLPFKFCWDIQEDPQPISSSVEENNKLFVNYSIILSIDPIMEIVDKFLCKYKGFYFVRNQTSAENIDSIESFEIQDDDIFLITYPKSGTVWTQNILSLIFYEGHRDGTENITLIDRIPWLEYNVFQVDLTSRPSPRVICSHLPYYLVPKGLQNKRAKIIYVFRNPKDVLASMYHFHKISVTLETPKDFDTFLEKFLAGKVGNSLWLDHIEGWCTHKDDFNILFLSYEEMKKDLRSSVLKICNFLGKELSEKEVDDVVDKATFDNMKMDARANYRFMPSDQIDFSKGDFLRKGTIGDWKNLMTVAQSERFDRVFRERMEKLPFRFCWDIQEDPQPISSSAEENNITENSNIKFCSIVNYDRPYRKLAMYASLKFLFLF
ncbi:hypothetical protein E2320_020046, partial [Naja naja]